MRVRTLRPNVRAADARALMRFLLLDAFDRRGSALLACMHACMRSSSARLHAMLSSPASCAQMHLQPVCFTRVPNTQAKRAVALENSTDCTLLSIFGQMGTNARQRALACEHERLPGLAAPRCAD